MLCCVCFCRTLTTFLRLLSGSEWDPVCSPCSAEGLYLAKVCSQWLRLRGSHISSTLFYYYHPPTQVDYAPEALENATECFLEMLDMEKVVRMGAEDQQDDLDLDEEEDIGGETLEETREEYHNK